MMNMHTQSVNVARDKLLEQLRKNLEQHQKDYQEALVEYHTRLIEDLKVATKKVSKVENIEELKNFRFALAFPQNHEQEFKDVIDMLEWSVDDTINLDADSFRAYFKNEWNWQKQFQMSKMTYASAGSAMSI